jgi:hypothetical protein
MKLPHSLIDKKIMVLNGPIIPGQIDPSALERVEINYLDNEISIARMRYPKSYLVNHLSNMINELKQDIIALRAHISYINCEQEDAL